MKISKSTLKISLIAGLSITFLLIMWWGFWLETQASKTTTWNFLFNVGYGLIYLFGAIIGAFGAVRVGLRKAPGMALLFLGLSLFSQALGLFTWAYYNLVLHVNIPSPSLGDVFLLVFFLPLVIASFVFLLNTFKNVGSIFSVLLALITFLVSIGVIFGIIERPDISSNHPLIQNLISVSYPFVDCILLSFSAFLISVASSQFRTAFLIIVAGFIVQVAADLTYAVRVGQGVYWNGDIADKLYATAAFVLGLGVMNLFFYFWKAPHSTTIKT
jgi:hypothetical protein